MYGQRWRLTRTRKSETVYLKARAGQNWSVPFQTVSQLGGRDSVPLDAMPNQLQSQPQNGEVRGPIATD